MISMAPFLFLDVLDEAASLVGLYCVDHRLRRPGAFRCSLFLEAAAPDRCYEAAFMRLELAEYLVRIIALHENAVGRLEAAHVRNKGHVKAARSV